MTSVLCACGKPAVCIVEGRYWCANTTSGQRLERYRAEGKFDGVASMEVRTER